jgi:pimeloyl-ACP methyl ester carboxylesterase
MDDLTPKANDPMRISGLRAAGAAPAKRGGAVGASKGPHEVAWVAVADLPADLLHCQVSLDQETPCLCHAALVGNSIGCQVIADLAVRYPARVARAVLQGPTMDPKGRSFSRQVGRFLLDVPREPLSLVPIELLDHLSAGTRQAWHTFRYALEDRIEEKLPYMRVPTLVVCGSRDPIVPQRWAKEATRLLPMGQLSVISGAAHTANYGWAAEFARVTQTVLDEGNRSPLGERP